MVNHAIKNVHASQFLTFGLSQNEAENIALKINQYTKNFPADIAWHKITNDILNRQQPFELHLFIFKYLFPNWPDELESGCAWIPQEHHIKNSNLIQAMAKFKIHSYQQFHAWSVNHFEKFWDYVIKKLNIKFQKQPDKIVDLSNGIESPLWFPEAKLNIAESCFTASPDKTAIIYQSENQSLQKITYGELNKLSNQIANSLTHLGFNPGDAIAINMPMTHFAVAIYLGILKIGGIVVSIADSFSREEVAMRLRIARTKAIFTQDFILRDNKKLPLYEKIIDAHFPPAIVLPSQDKLSLTLRSGDLDWSTFLMNDNNFTANECEPMAHCNILFSSGTTGEPKAIPWSHTTAIKAASDAYFHQNIQSDDILSWPTNLGWMMGPWLIFAALINQATIALYEGVPRSDGFGKFIQDAHVTMLGVVPTLVASWRQSHCMEKFDWRAIKVFASTGECSNPEDMLYLMYLANYKPIIEYCGGTEIGGAYISSTIIQNNYPSVFTTPTLGLNLILLDDNKNPAYEGEVALIPPSIGLSTELLNANHHQNYFENMPTTPDGKMLRRHGDQIRQLPTGYYTILGRADDTMNLGGIKISSAEIERTLSGIENIIETAAIAISPTGHGPSQLVIYAATKTNLDKKVIQKIMQDRINQHLNPLFKIYDIVFITELPKTASNKIMRRVLRKKYIEKSSNNETPS